MIARPPSFRRIRPAAGNASFGDTEFVFWVGEVSP